MVGCSVAETASRLTSMSWKEPGRTGRANALQWQRLHDGLTIRPLSFLCLRGSEHVALLNTLFLLPLMRCISLCADPFRRNSGRYKQDYRGPQSEQEYFHTAFHGFALIDAKLHNSVAFLSTTDVFFDDFFSFIDEWRVSFCPLKSVLLQAVPGLPASISHSNLQSPPDCPKSSK